MYMLFMLKVYSSCFCSVLFFHHFELTYKVLFIIQDLFML